MRGVPAATARVDRAPRVFILPLTEDHHRDAAERSREIDEGWAEDHAAGPRVARGRRREARHALARLSRHGDPLRHSEEHRLGALQGDSRRVRRRRHRDRRQGRERGKSGRKRRVAGAQHHGRRLSSISGSLARLLGTGRTSSSRRSSSRPSGDEIHGFDLRHARASSTRSSISRPWRSWRRDRGNDRAASGPTAGEPARARRRSDRLREPRRRSLRREPLRQRRVS